MPNSYGVFRSHIGFASETAYGTSATAIQVAIPFLSYDDYTDDQGLVMDEGGQAKASKLYAAYTGMQQGKWSGTAPYYLNECYRFFVRTLGLDTVNSSSVGGWQHSITLADLPASDTIFDFYGSTLGDRAFSGAQCESVTFKFDRASGLATIKPTYKTAAPTTGPGTELTPAYGSASTGLMVPVRGWEGVFAIAGSTRNTLLTYEMTLSRDVELIFAGNNSQRPSGVEVGNFDVSGKISFYGSTDQPMIDYRANTQQAFDLVLRDASTTLASSSGGYLEFTASKALFTKVVPDRSGKFLRYDAEFRGIHNTSAGGDSGPCQFITTIQSSSAMT